MITANGLLYVRRPWICMHGVDVDESDGCRNCEASLQETLAAARRRHIVQQLQRESKEARTALAALDTEVPA